MSWTPDEVSGGFSSCNSSECRQRFEEIRKEIPLTNVKVRND